MNLRYLVQELRRRRRRTLTAVFSLATAVALLVLINALAQAYRQAAAAPLKEIGADLTVQRAGDVPEELSGPVFPCSATTIRAEEVARIGRLPGIRRLGTGLLLWVFDPEQAWIVLGVPDEQGIGPGLIRHHLSEGRFFQPGESAALLEASFARQAGIRLGDSVLIAGHSFPVTGLVDGSRAVKIAAANVYLPLQDAQGLAVASPQLQHVSPFAPGDVNLLFLSAEQPQLAGIDSSLKEILGPRASVASPDTFLQGLGNIFALSDRFALAASLAAILVAVLITSKTMAGHIVERTGEIGVLKAVGWTVRNVTSQITAESLCQCLLAGSLGLLAAWVGTLLLGLVSVDIPIPWEMSPRPHFLAGGGDLVFKTIQLPIRIPASLALGALALSLGIGAISGGLVGRAIACIKPSEVLRNA